MKKIACMVIVSLLFCAVSASAYEGDKYIGLNVTRLEYSEDGFSSDFNPIALAAKVGYQFFDYFAVEARGGAGIMDDDENFFGVDVSMKINYLVGVYGKGILNLNDQFNFYGMLGFTLTKMTVKSMGQRVSDDDAGLSFGLGMDAELMNQVYIGLECMNYFMKTDSDTIAIAIGITKNF